MWGKVFVIFGTLSACKVVHQSPGPYQGTGLLLQLQAVEVRPLRWEYNKIKPLDHARRKYMLFPPSTHFTRSQLRFRLRLL